MTPFLLAYFSTAIVVFAVIVSIPVADRTWKDVAACVVLAVVWPIVVGAVGIATTLRCRR